MVLGGLSHRDQARLKVQGRDGTQLELLTDGDTRRLVGFSFSAAAVVLVVFIGWRNLQLKLLPSALT